ncbi:hypothetical protein F4778DRAFT_716375 [Xylariomycetidae sp. FL2044]|nr:hypothetical protein F4778DRAFT_716375 [Xylariomycetidae sp. FL2044]
MTPPSIRRRRGGTLGMWLIELHSELSKRGVSAQLDGYDIHPINFPSPTLLPQSIRLKTLDVLARPLPAELIGTYDIVHIKGFVSIILHSDVTPVLSTALALLRPGGWLQWSDVRSDSFVAEAPAGKRKDCLRYRATNHDGRCRRPRHERGLAGCFGPAYGRARIPRRISPYR